MFSYSTKAIVELSDFKIVIPLKGALMEEGSSAGGLERNPANHWSERGRKRSVVAARLAPVGTDSPSLTALYSPKWNYNSPLSLFNTLL